VISYYHLQLTTASVYIGRPSRKRMVIAITRLTVA
jgi:hypothetical protein